MRLGWVWCYCVLQNWAGVSSVSWEEWWTYDGISGPSFWGLINPDWSLCNAGRRQSPIDLDPQRLLYDPLLRDLEVTEAKIDGVLSNSGHSIVFSLATASGIFGDAAASGPATLVNISGGPLSYQYPIHSVQFHFGMESDSGSEHTVAGNAFPGEIQLIGYNADLYDNFTVASKQPHGLVAVSVLLQVGDLSNGQVRRVTQELHRVQFGGDQIRLQNMSPADFLPKPRKSDEDGDQDKSSASSVISGQYITYEGSLTEPGCQETVTWIIMNRPAYITEKQLIFFRKLMQGEQKDPRAPLGGNFRPIQALNGRTLRTNVMVSGDQFKS